MWLAINGLGLKIVLGVASEWSERKGLKDLFRLAQMLPRNEYVILIVGKIFGKKQDKPEGGCRMIFIERTQNQLELAQMYLAASVFVNPTYQDNYPTVNLEAMACGTPVITYNTGGSPEAVDEETGAVVKQGDVERFGEEVIRLANGDYCEKCRKRAELMFDKSGAYNQYVKLYNKLLGGGGLTRRDERLKVVLGVAHPWSERKGLKDYVKLSKILPKGVVIVLVGLSDEQQRRLPENIIGLGATQNVNELVMLYSMADVVLNLSSAETFGLTTVEGFACGVPGIVYNSTASPELVTTGTGFVIEAGNVNDVAVAISEILSNGKEYYKVACRARAEQEFNKNKCFEKYLELYDEMIKSRNV